MNLTPTLESTMVVPELPYWTRWHKNWLRGAA